ncbi:beta-galactosidase GalA [Prevotella sp. KH2C16]|uniref:beta-galactosidase GalA n=1 Tax=Prevotella sp. KH2C16 TaxID=1855325 RepID=UPI000B814BB4|nr:beta-galactosidase GalA [Prevotella sp. KH2C16]
MKKLLATLCLISIACGAGAQRETTSLDNDWTFHLGNAASMEKDFSHGTEYFTYLTKAVGQNQGPASEKFDDSSWTSVNLPHDWVVDLPYSGEASHSHGYKQVGWKYPGNSVGWYRKRLFIPAEAKGRHLAVRFDGIFRNSQVFCNGFYLGHEVSGYASREYTLTEYLNYGGENIITVRCDASTEEGWFYEGAGIYRHAWLIETAPLHFKSDRIFFRTRKDGDRITFTVSSEVDNPAGQTGFRVTHALMDGGGSEVARIDEGGSAAVSRAHYWSSTDPYLYTLVSRIADPSGKVTDEVRTKVGLRTMEFNLEKGFLLNGKAMKLRGVNMHLDHAGVGVGLPDEVWRYEVMKLKELGVNAIRCSHNPATPAMLDICDSLGILVIDENRLMGTNEEHLDLLRRMIQRDRNHPSVILWSIGNEEWWIESTEKGESIARRMIDFARTIDDTRPYTYGNSGGFGLTKQVDIHGYNYIFQNDVENRHKTYPDWFVVGTEETSGCGTRNIYETDSLKGWMKSINYEGEERSGGEKNVIERGWKYYRDNSYTGGIFYWTGFDYRGEPNPMKWPATGSQFGILDYCGFPKDEAYYLKAAWTAEPVLHIFPHWNLKGKEGQPVEVWAYSNMDEVELFQDGRSLGRQKMPRDGHLVWSTTYRPGRLVANGFKNGKKVLTTRVETTDEASKVVLKASKNTLLSDGQDAVVIDISLLDKKSRRVPDACDKLAVSVTGAAAILGWGNGDPGFKETERPTVKDCQQAELKAFMGHAQVILRGVDGKWQEKAPVTLTVQLANGGKAVLRLN